MFPKDALLLIYAHIRAHLGIQKKFHGIHPSGVHTFFFKNLCVLISETFFQRKTGSHFFPKSSWLFSQNLTIFFLRLFILIPRIMRKLGVFNYDLRNIGE